MCQRVPLTPVQLTSGIFNDVLASLRESHSNGGAVLAAFRISSDDCFDWYASRNRLLEDSILVSLLSRPEVRLALPELMIPSEADLIVNPPPCPIGAQVFSMESPFLFDGRLAQCLHSGGAYWHKRGDGKEEKQLALRFCEAAFDLRFSEIQFYVSYNAWTRWFYNVAWDWTSILFDRNLRTLWILAVTDTD